MQLKKTTVATHKNMASIKDEEQQQGQNNNNIDSSGNGNSSSNVNNTEDIKNKKQTLENRKQELEKLLNEKSWLLQQIQKQETQIMHGNNEYMSLNEFFANLAHQYKQEQQMHALVKNNNNNENCNGNSSGCGVADNSILRRKVSTSSKENQAVNNNRNSEISNRSSEYDNYHPNVIENNSSLSGAGVQQQSHQLPVKSALKKRATPTPTPTPTLQPSLNYLQMQRQQQQLLMLQQHTDCYPYVVQMSQPQQQQQPQQHLHHHHLQQQSQQRTLYGAHSPQYQKQSNQQQQSPSQQQTHFDGISLYSANSANVATLRQQHIAPQQQPIIVQCDKYYLSPTHQSYNEGGFIKSSQNIKKYISPLASPTHHYEMPHQTPQSLQQQQQLQLDAISLAPSYVSMDGDGIQQFRWRSQTHIGPLTPPHATVSYNSGSASSNQNLNADSKSHSSDMLATPNHTHHTHAYTQPPHTSQQQQQQQQQKHQQFAPPQPPKPHGHTKPLDEISLSSLSTNEKKQKSKQWLESSLDGPVIRGPVDSSNNISSIATQSMRQSTRERTKLSSQSMSASGVVGSSGRHYSMSSARTPTTSNTTGIVSNVKMFQHDDGRYAKLSQSTSYLNAMENNTQTGISAPYMLDLLDIPAYKQQLPPKPNTLGSQPPMQHTSPPPPPPRLPVTADKAMLPPLPLLSPPVVAAASNSAALSPDIRIESPKNMTVVQQATFQPYKEVTKPFEMSDFYKYSTKFKQKEAATRQATPPIANFDGN